MYSYVYVMDVFRPIDMDFSKLTELALQDPQELFNEVKEIVEEYVGQVKHVRLLHKYIDTKHREAVIEYIINCSIGEVSVKIVHARNTLQIMRKFYKLHQ